MRTINRMMVALDLSGMDQKLLEYSHQLVKLLDIDKLYFLHVMPDMMLPENKDIEFHKLFSSKYPVDEKVRDKIALDVEEELKGVMETSIDINVVEGAPYKKLLQWASLKEVDLVVVGRKMQSQGSGITARRVARHANCHVLFVPEKAAPQLSKIVVPVDFSSHSAVALQTALGIKNKKEQEVEVIALHVIDLPPVDYLGQPVNNYGFKNVLETSAAEAYEKMLAKYTIPKEQVQYVTVDNVCANKALHIHEYAKVNNADMVIIGAEGHSAFNTFLFGSVTEKLVERNLDKPVLIVRESKWNDTA